MASLFSLFGTYKWKITTFLNQIYGKEESKFKVRDCFLLHFISKVVLLEAHIFDQKVGKGIPKWCECGRLGSDIIAKTSSLVLPWTFWGMLKSKETLFIIVPCL